MYEWHKKEAPLLGLQGSGGGLGFLAGRGGLTEDFVLVWTMDASGDATSPNFKDFGTVTETDNSATCTQYSACLLYTSPSPRDKRQSRMPSSA